MARRRHASPGEGLLRIGESLARVGRPKSKGRARKKQSRSDRSLIPLLLGLGLLAVVALLLRTDTGRAVLAAIVALPLAVLISFRLWRRQRRLRQTRDLGSLLSVTPAEFERRVALILARSGYRSVRVSGGRGDLAVDITCKGPKGESVVVQCKQYALHRRVGSPEVQTFIGMAFAHHSASRGLYVTTTDYTRDAHRLAAQHRIELIDGTQLVRMANRRGAGEGAEQ
jgi:restriction system protein